MAPPMSLASRFSTVQVHASTASVSDTIYSEATALPIPQRNGSSTASYRQQKKTFLVMIPLAVLTVLGIAGGETIDHFSKHAKSDSTADTANNETSRHHQIAAQSTPSFKPIETPAAGDHVNMWIRNVTSDHLYQSATNVTGAQSIHGEDEQVNTTDRELQRRAPPITKATKRIIKLYVFPTIGWLVGSTGAGWMISDKIEGGHHVSDRASGPPATGKQPHDAQQSDVRLKPRTFFDNRMLRGITKWGKDVGEWTPKVIKPDKKRVAKTTYSIGGYLGLVNGLVVAPIVYETTGPHHKSEDKSHDTVNATATPAAQASDLHDNPPNDKLQARGAPPTMPTWKNISALLGMIGLGSGTTMGLAFGLAHTKEGKEAIARGKRKHGDQANDKLEKAAREKWRKEHPISDKRDIAVGEGKSDLLPVLFDLGYLSSPDKHNAPTGKLSVGMGEDGYLDIFAEETGIHFNGTISKIHHTTENGIAVGNLTVSLPGENKTSNAGHWYSVDPKQVGAESINAFAEMFANRTEDSTDEFNLTVDVDTMTRHFSMLFGH